MNDAHLYKHAHAVLDFTAKVYGGIPRTKKLIDNYVTSKFGVVAGDLAEDLKKEVDLLEEQENITTGFKHLDGMPYLSDYQVKAMIKQAATRLKLTTKKRGTKQDITDGFFLTRKIFPTLDNTKMKDGKLPVDDIPGHVMTPQGKRSILKASEYIERGRVEIDIKLIITSVMSKKDLLNCFLIGQEIGLGSNRSFENGKFNLVSFEWEDGDLEEGEKQVAPGITIKKVVEKKSKKKK